MRNRVESRFAIPPVAGCLCALALSACVGNVGLQVQGSVGASGVGAMGVGGASATGTGGTSATGAGGTSTTGVGGSSATGTAGAGTVTGTAGAGGGPVVVECNSIAPGRSPLRRLTTYEYNNTIRDLLGDTTNLGSALPPQVDSHQN